MRLHRLQLQAFQAFAGPQDIDFDALSDAGLFLLHGDTGAGKTTLLDAIFFALYGGLPGARGADARIRSDHAAVDVPTQVTLELTIREERLRIVRTPEQERPKARGEGMTRAQASVRVSRLEPDGSETVLATRLDEAGLELREKMGMSREQFAQVVLLPQGRFATFLQAQSKDRVALLKPIFGAERFEHAEAWLAEQARDAGARLDRATDGVGGTVAQLEQAAGSPPPEGWEEQPEVLMAWASEQEDGARRRATLAGEAETLTARARTEAQDAALDAKALAQRRARAAAATISLREHRERGTDREAWEVVVRAARAVEGVLPRLDALARATDAVQEAGRAAQEALAQIGPEPGADVTATALREQASARDTAAGEARGLLPVEREAAARREALDARRQELQQARSAHDEGVRWLAAVRERSAMRLQELRDEHGAAVTAEQAAHGTWLTLREQRLDGMAAELAAGLVPGEPCAVCGSPEHPAPADGGGGPRVTQEQEAAAQEAHERARAAREALSLQVDAEQALRRAAEAAAGEAAPPAGAPGRDVVDATAETVEARRAQVGRHAAALAALQEGIDGAERTLAQDEQRLIVAREGAGSVAERVAELQQQATVLRAAAQAVQELAQAERIQEEARADAQGAAREARFDDLDAARAAARTPEEVAELEARIRGYDGELVARTQRAEDPELLEAAATEAPDVAGLERVAATATAAAEEASRLVGAADSTVRQLEHLRATLAGQLQELVPVAQRAATTRAVAALVAGSSTQNTKNMSLTTYVLAAWLEQIAAAASVRLGAMTDGRYRLAHTDEGTDGRRRAGLNLTVIDGWTGRERHPSTLSGGETFMASLALALGLADVVTAEAGGGRLDTLFVDEGFGSLDEGTLEEVLDVLDRLREGGRVVGIVSHVPELRQRIPAQLHVIKGRNGSHVSEVVGRG